MTNLARVAGLSLLAAAVGLGIPDAAEAGHRHSRDCGHRYDGGYHGSRYGGYGYGGYGYGRGYGYRQGYGYAPYGYGHRCSRSCRHGYPGYGYGYAPGYYAPAYYYGAPPPPPRYYRRPRVGIYLQF
jgi:hypothetical protein